MMSLTTKMTVVCMSLLCSVGYGIVVATDKDFATALAVGYIAIFITLTVIIHMGRRK